MSGGLKQQWGVCEAAQAGSDAQSQELKTAFEKAMNAMAEHLQYTAANPAPPLEKGKGSRVVLDAFHLSRSEGGKPMNLAAMARKPKPLSDSRTGRLHVVAFWSGALGNDEDGMARRSGVVQNRPSARASQTAAALQEFSNRTSPGASTRKSPTSTRLCRASPSRASASTRWWWSSFRSAESDCRLSA